jgi:hypothetical protein
MIQYIKTANAIIENYCQTMEVPVKVLLRRDRNKKSKYGTRCYRKYGTISLSFMRQSLGYYLYKNLPLTTTQIGQMIGYSDHSSVVLYSKIVEDHFDVKDPYFVPYYDKLVEVADPLMKDVVFDRNDIWKVRYQKSVDKRVGKLLAV